MDVHAINLATSKNDTVINEMLLGSQIKAGNKDAFRLLYNLYSKKIYGFALSYLKSNSEAEEVIQAVFVKLWEGRQEIKEHLSLQSYLYKITTNHIYNYLKHKKVQLAANNELQLVDLDNSTQEHIFYNNLQENINSLIEKMPEQRRRAFKLSRMEGLSHEEIAKRLDISVRTVESQIYKALKFLKKNLKDELLITLFLTFFR